MLFNSYWLISFDFMTGRINLLDLQQVNIWPRNTKNSEKKEETLILGHTVVILGNIHGIVDSRTLESFG